VRCCFWSPDVVCLHEQDYKTLCVRLHENTCSCRNETVREYICCGTWIEPLNLAKIGLKSTSRGQHEHSKSANLCQCQKLKQKRSGIQEEFFGLIWIRMSVRSAPKCWECIILLASVILPIMIQIGCWVSENANKCPKIPYSAVVKKIKKWSGIHMRTRSPPKLNHF